MGMDDTEFDADTKYYCVVSTAPAEKQWCATHASFQQHCAFRCQPLQPHHEPRSPRLPFPQRR